ncbi:MAG: DUF4384 domain-containing protein [Smithellaceae bacterium]
MFRIIFAVICCLLVFSGNLYAAQSAITEAEGYSCAGDDKSRKQTEVSAMSEAKRTAVENAVSYIKSETKMKDFQVEKDVVEAYSNAAVKVIEIKERNWYKDERSGDCYRIKIKAEVIPDEKAMSNLAANQAAADNPALPLNVKVWTDKKQYKNKEQIKIFLKGNKPFYARVLYVNVRGESLQLLPNPSRSDNYFNGGVIYEIPSGNDRFELEVNPPFGEEKILVYASSTELGKINVKAAGAVYEVKTDAEDVGVKTRGIQLKEKSGESKPTESFYEEKIIIKTFQ